MHLLHDVDVVVMKSDKLPHALVRKLTVLVELRFKQPDPVAHASATGVLEFSIGLLPHLSSPVYLLDVLL